MWDCLRRRPCSASPTTELTRWAGPIAAEPIDAAGEQAAQKCSPGSHTGVWLLHLAHGSQTLDLPIYLAPTGTDDPPAATLKLELCPPAADAQLARPRPPF